MSLWELAQRYGKVAVYTIAVIAFTRFLFGIDDKLTSFERKSVEANEQLKVLNERVSTLTDAIGTTSRDRERYERWKEMTDARLKRLFNRNGWEYEPIR